MKGNAKPIAKLVSQFTMVAMETAKGLASCWKSSDTINQGMAPGPSAKQLVIPNVKMTRNTPGTVGYDNIIT